MYRYKDRDYKYFNCSEDHEVRYVAGLYEDSDKVHDFLQKKCGDGTINYSTHMEVYELIERELGYPIPV